MNTRTSKILIATALLLTSLARLDAQSSGIGVSLLVATPPPRYFYEWSSQPSAATLIVTNPGTAPIVARFQAELRLDGRLAAETKPELMPLVTIPPGGRTFTGADLLPYEAIRFHGDLSTIVRTGALPDGTYELCVQLYGPTGEELGSMSGCAQFAIIRYDPPTLIAPADGDTLQRERLPGTALVWTPQQPTTSTPSRYAIRLVRRRSYQSATAALTTERPVVDRSVVGSTQFFLAYEGTQSWEAGTYVWQVQARDEQGTPFTEWSEPFTFTLTTRSPAMTTNATTTSPATVTTSGETESVPARSTVASTGPCPELEKWLQDEQRTLDSLTARRQAVADSLASVTDSLARLRATFTTDSARTAPMAAEYEAAATECDAISQKIGELQRRRKELEGTYRKASYKDREDALASLKELESEMKDLMERSDRAWKRRHEMWGRYKPLRDSLRALELRIRPLERLLERLQWEAESLDQQIRWETDYRDNAGRQLEDCRKQIREEREKEVETFAHGLDLDGEMVATRHRIDSIRSLYAGREWPPEAERALAEAERRLREAERESAAMATDLDSGRIGSAERHGNQAEEALSGARNRADAIPEAFAGDERRRREREQRERAREERERRSAEEQERLEQQSKELRQRVDEAGWSVLGWEWLTMGDNGLQGWLDGRLEMAKNGEADADKALNEAKRDLRNGDLADAEKNQKRAEEAMGRANDAIDDIENVMNPKSGKSPGSEEMKEIAKSMLTDIFNTLGELSEHSSEAEILRIAGRIMVIVDGVRSIAAVPCCVKEFLESLGKEVSNTSNPVGLNGSIQAIIANLKQCANLPSALTSVDLGAARLADALSAMSIDGRRTLGDALKNAARKIECHRN